MTSLGPISGLAFLSAPPFYNRFMAPQFVRSAIRKMEGYIPGEQPGAAQRVVELNTNENPYPPSECVMKSISSVNAESLRRYPNPNADVFRDVAAKLHGVTREHIIAGNGSDDILAIAMGCFLPPGGRLAYPEPTYSLYPVLAAISECVANTRGLGSRLVIAYRAADCHQRQRDFSGQSQRAERDIYFAGENRRSCQEISRRAFGG